MAQSESHVDAGLAVLGLDLTNTPFEVSEVQCSGEINLIGLGPRAHEVNEGSEKVDDVHGQSLGTGEAVERDVSRRAGSTNGVQVSPVRMA